MPNRVNGGVINAQMLTGSLYHYSLVGADLSGAVDLNGKPVLNSAADVIATLISVQATIAILHPSANGMSFALETTRADWDAARLQSAIRQLGDNVGVDRINLEHIVVFSNDYEFNGGKTMNVISASSVQAVPGVAYLADVDTTLTLPDYSDIPIGSSVTVLKNAHVESVLVVSTDSQPIITSSGTDTQLIIDSTFEYIFVFNGQSWTLSY